MIPVLYNTYFNYFSKEAKMVYDYTAYIEDWKFNYLDDFMDYYINIGGIY